MSRFRKLTLPKSSLHHHEVTDSAATASTAEKITDNPDVTAAANISTPRIPRDVKATAPEFQLLQEKIISVNASHSKDFDSDQGEEEAYSDDEDTNSVFSYDEVDRDNSEFAGN
jgi:hypothetical protein